MCHFNAFNKTIVSTFEVRTLESQNSSLRCLISANQSQIDERPKNEKKLVNFPLTQLWHLTLKYRPAQVCGTPKTSLK